MMLVLALALALAVVALGVVAYPLFRAGVSQETLEERGPSELFSRRDAVYSAIKELEFERDLGSLSPQDFQSLEARYKGRAIAILKQLDHAASGKAWEEQIESEVARLRQAEKAGVASCPKCGASLTPGSRFCSECGTPQGNACPSCGAAIKEGDRFCSQCGASLSPGGKG